MLNITTKDKNFLNAFFRKNVDLKMEIVRFESNEQREAYHKNVAEPDSLYIEEIFIRREYNGVECYLYIFIDDVSPKIYRKEVFKDEKKK